jgi:hypothetical protein
VDVTDLGNLASGYGMASGATWQVGDFDYNDRVDVSDLGDLASNYGASLAAGGALLAQPQADPGALPMAVSVGDRTSRATVWPATSAFGGSPALATDDAGSGGLGANERRKRDHVAVVDLERSAVSGAGAVATGSVK